MSLVSQAGGREFTLIFQYSNPMELKIITDRLLLLEPKGQSDYTILDKLH